MRDVYGAPYAVIAGFSYPDDIDSSVFLFDIDACGLVDLMQAGVFNDVEEAAASWRATVGALDEERPPAQVHAHLADEPAGFALEDPPHIRVPDGVVRDALAAEHVATVCGQELRLRHTGQRGGRLKIGSGAGVAR